MEKSLACDGNIVHEEAVQAVRQQWLPEGVLVDAANFFKVMGDGTRFRILYALDKEELCVCDLAQVLEMSVSAISHQLKRLRDSQLVKSRREGKNVFYSLDDEHVGMMLKGCVEHAREGRQG